MDSSPPPSARNDFENIALAANRLESAKDSPKQCIKNDELIVAIFDDSDLSEAPSSPLSSPPWSDYDWDDDHVRKRRRLVVPLARMKRKPVRRKEFIYHAYEEPPLPFQDVEGYPRKEFLNAGFYCADPLKSVDKTNDEPKRLRASTVSTGVVKSSEMPKSRQLLLPLPTGLGEWKLKQEVDFSLPFDIIFEFDNHLIKSDKQPPPYVNIRSNIFVERKRRTVYSPAVCSCKKPDDLGMGCLEDCINRYMFYECMPDSCPCGEQCANRQFQSGNCNSFSKDLEVFYCGPSRGFGLKTNAALKRNQLVIEYVGEVISNDTAQDRAETVYKDAKCFYFLDYNKSEVLDGGLKGNEARFVNHSCDPNCHIEKWHVAGEMRVGLFASRNIPAGSELTYDYNFHNFGARKVTCGCGSSKCRGVMGKIREVEVIAEPVLVENDKKSGTRSSGDNRQSRGLLILGELRKSFAPRRAFKTLKLEQKNISAPIVLPRNLLTAKRELPLTRGSSVKKVAKTLDDIFKRIAPPV